MKTNISRISSSIDRAVSVGTALVLAVWFGSIGMAFAQTEILMFDDLPFTFNANGVPIPSGYGGLQWQNFSLLDVRPSASPIASPNGYNNSDVSPYNVIVNGAGNPAFISDGSFDLDSAFLTAAWNDGLQVEAQGFVGASMAYDNVYTLNTAGPTFINFDYLGVTSVEFISSGGVRHLGFNGAGTQFAMDNLTITLVPEPTTFALSWLAVTFLTLRCLTLETAHRKAVCREWSLKH